MSKSKPKQNSGKRFEGDVSSSVPSHIFVHRLNDSAQAYNNSKKTSFCWNNKCDFFLFRKPILIAVECKSTKYKSMSVQMDKNDSDSSMIKHHQIESLKGISKHDGVVAGFLFNFRHFEGEENSFETTYFQSIDAFLNMMKNINKKSFNEIDLINSKDYIRVCGELKRSHYRWDISKLLDDIDNKFYNK